MILLLAISRKKRAIEALPIPEMILKGGGASISNFTRFLIAKTEPAYMILILEAWMAQYEKDPEEESGEIIPDHPVLALLKTPNPYDTEDSFLGAWARNFLISGNTFLKRSFSEPEEPNIFFHFINIPFNKTN